MITSIQIHEKVKSALDKLKEKEKESYEEVIVKMMQKIEHQERQKKGLLKEGYQEMAEESKKIAEEWSTVDKELMWE